MSRETVFLTGATGTVGSGILEVLAANGYEVHCLIRTAGAAQKITRLGGHAIAGDMTDPAVFHRLAADQRFTYIIHAAQAHYRNHSTAEIHRQETIALANLEILRTAGTQLMVFTCGVWIYGNCPGGASIDESTPRVPRPEAADRARLMVSLAARRDSVWAQFCLPNFVYGSTGPFIELAQQFGAGDVEIADDVGAVWSVIERLDLGHAYLALLRHGKPGDYFVVAEDDPIGVVAFHEAIAGHLRRGSVIRKVLPASPGASTSHPVNSARFKQRTGWRARESFMISLARFLPPPPASPAA